MNTFPLFANLQNRPVLVVGGGAVAARKIANLLAAQARVSVVSPDLSDELAELAAQNRITHLAAQFSPEQLDGVFFVIAATNDRTTNEAVFQAAEARYKLCNVVDNADLCSAVLPSVIDRSPLQIAVSSSGKAPVLARQCREKLESLLPLHLAGMAQMAGQWRSRVKQTLPENQRRIFWENLFRNPQFAAAHENGDFAAAERILQDSLTTFRQPETGSVALVGAGPGDAGLLTLKALQHIQSADVVLYDALVSPAVLDLIRRDAQRIFVGKRAHKHRAEQDEINALLVQLAQQGKRVVRLKGGDPFVFGRGGEELLALRQHGIPYTVVSGITAALGATAYAGIPLTHRDVAQSVMLLTGRIRPDGHALHWQTLSQGEQTLVVYMGTIKATELTEKLIGHGRSPNTPVAVISHGTLPSQQVFSGSLKDLPTLAQNAPMPALIVIGETAKLHDKLKWFQAA